MTKGYKAENKLNVIVEDEYGYAAIRGPGSGGGTSRARPDLVAIKADYTKDYGVYEKIERRDVVVIELKASSDGTAYLDSHEVEELNEWANRAGGNAYVIVKPDLRSHDQWYCFKTNQLNETENGYSITKDMLPEAFTLDEVFA